MKNIHEYLTSVAEKAENKGFEVWINDGEDILTLKAHVRGNGHLGACIFNEMTGQTTSVLAMPLWVVQEFIDKIEDLNK